MYLSGIIVCLLVRHVLIDSLGSETELVVYNTDIKHHLSDVLGLACCSVVFVLNPKQLHFSFVVH